MSDPYIKEASALMEQAKGAMASGADQAKSMAGNVDVQKLMPYLLAGGAGAVGGAALSGRRKERQGETRGQYLTRILRNAVTAGALTGVGSYAAGEGFKKTVGKVDLENPITGTADDQGPLAASGRQALFGAPAAIIAGATGLGATVGGKRLGANPNLGEAGDNLIAGLKLRYGGKLPPGVNDVASMKMLAKTDPAGLQAVLGGDEALIHEAKRIGINTHDPKEVTQLPGLLRKIVGKDLTGVRHKIHEAARIPSNLMGRTTGRRVGRGALGLGAALIPAIAGSILTDRPE